MRTPWQSCCWLSARHVTCPSVQPSPLSPLSHDGHNGQECCWQMAAVRRRVKTAGDIEWIQLQPCYRVAPRAGVLGLPWEPLYQGLVSVFQSHFVASLNPISRLTLIILNTYLRKIVKLVTASKRKIPTKHVIWPKIHLYCLLLIHGKRASFDRCWGRIAAFADWMFISIIWNCNFTIIMSKLLIAELS